MTLLPLRWRVEHDAIVAAGNIVHRPGCRHIAGDRRALSAGQALELDRGPTRCNRCWPDFELQLGTNQRV